MNGEGKRGVFEKKCARRGVFFGRADRRAGDSRVLNEICDRGVRGSFPKFGRCRTVLPGRLDFQRPGRAVLAPHLTERDESLELDCEARCTPVVPNLEKKSKSGKYFAKSDRGARAFRDLELSECGSAWWNGGWAVGSWRWTVDSGQWTVDRGQLRYDRQ